ncbi:hypothetical protein [Desulfosarcina ovata]|uniref:Uncharacterized protein n=1 Tax=Desulfosarcina ovata subsp. ovata TaxID=2752305 RepID=A0A5K8AH92_9BACT|nr:hypothetical protein [Desulfosarcina ovata]BBO92045.1 hypothetical protein DSCOOX_52250 [Desulfosarcina ovata subsp. ovata]
MQKTVAINDAAEQIQRTITMLEIVKEGVWGADSLDEREAWAYIAKNMLVQEIDNLSVTMGDLNDVIGKSHRIDDRVRLSTVR